MSKQRSEATFETTLNRILLASNTRRKNTVGKFVQVLYRMRERGNAVFTVAEVGRECELAKVVKTQVIRNASGKPYRELIDAFVLQHGLSQTSQPQRQQTHFEQLLHQISDLHVRTMVRSTFDDAEALRRQVEILKSGFKKITLPVRESTEKPVEILPPQRKQTLNLGPLERFISESWLNQNAWSVTESGTIMDGRDPITPPGFVPALRNVLDEMRTDSRPT